MRLDFGVIDVSYGAESYGKARGKKLRLGAAKRGKVSAPTPTGAAKSTGDVAAILEAKYHVFETFYTLHAQEIGDAVTQDLSDGLQDALAGRNSPTSFTASESAVFTMFQKFIDSKEMDGTQGGVPTLASLKGVNHRFRHPYARGNPVRPSFRDTGLYEQSAYMTVSE